MQYAFKMQHTHKMKYVSSAAEIGGEREEHEEAKETRRIHSRQRCDSICLVWLLTLAHSLQFLS